MIEPLSMHALLLQLKHGHVEALDVLYPQYAVIFYAYARKQGLAHEDAEDIVQATFWHTLDNIGDYHEENGGGERWLWRICRNLIIDNLRRKIPRALPTAELLAEDSDPADYVIEQEQLLAFARAWHNLQEADRNELRRGRGRGPGRNAWHGALQRLRLLFLRSEQHE